LYDKDTNIYVVTDLNKRQYKYRLLCVGSGKKWHRSWQEYSPEEKNLLISFLMQVVRKHEEEKIGTMVKLDKEHFSVPEHGHIQACMI